MMQHPNDYAAPVPRAWAPDDWFGAQLQARQAPQRSSRVTDPVCLVTNNACVCVRVDKRTR